MLLFFFVLVTTLVSHRLCAASLERGQSRKKKRIRQKGAKTVETKVSLEDQRGRVNKKEKKKSIKGIYLLQNDLLKQTFADDVA